ncbi:DNA-directed RNA polymerase [Stygiomarasmius scandens]|uniref:DNA-directed RNA polymerase n=1 Tax=Marasmiellus scandens TaxID=2682957 RepID=A0ABR1IZV2_9AGAR
MIGYLYNRVPVMRYKESVGQLSYLQRASELGNVELIYAGLGSTPWKINRGVFYVVLELYEEFRQRYKDYKIPLVYLHSGILNKALRDAGSRITVSSEQAESLGLNVRGRGNAGFGNLVTISDEVKSSIDESDETRELKDLLIDLAGKEGGLEGKDDEELLDAVTNAKGKNESDEKDKEEDED